MKVIWLLPVLLLFVQHLDDVTAKKGSGRGGSGGLGGVKTRSGVGGLLKSSSFKTAVAGAVGLYAGYKVMKAGSKLLNWDGRDYYFGPRYFPYYGTAPPPGQIVCKYDIDDDDDDDLRSWIYEDRTSIDEVYFLCRNTQSCCGMQCCNLSPQYQSSLPRWGVALIVLAVLLLLGCCACFIVYKMCRSALDCIFPSRKNEGNNYVSDVPMMDQSSANYPAGPPQGSYMPPPQGGYMPPAQGGFGPAPPSYDQAPAYPGYPSYPQGGMVQQSNAPYNNYPTKT